MLQWLVSIPPSGAPPFNGSCSSRRIRYRKHSSMFCPWVFLENNPCLFFTGMGYLVHFLLSMPVAEREPTPCYHDAYSVGTLRRACREKYGQTYCKTTFLPPSGVGPFSIFGCDYLDAPYWQSSTSWSWQEAFHLWSVVC